MSEPNVCPPNQPCRILTLPRELRDQIYMHLIEEYFAPPTRAHRTIPPPGTNGQLYLWCEHSEWKSLPLLAVSKQIRAEIQGLSAQLQRSNKMRFELDILAKGYVYTPKWTLINLALQPQSSLDLHVNLVIMSTEAFRRNDGWPRQPGHVFRTLLNFLTRLIFRGPSFLHYRPPFSTLGPHHINKLSVHVTFKDDYTRDTHAETVHEVFRMVKALTMLETASRYIGKAKVVADWTVRGQDYHRQREWDLQQCEAPMREDEWAAMGFYFGAAWVKKYAKSSGSSTPSSSKSL